MKLTGFFQVSTVVSLGKSKESRHLLQVNEVCFILDAYKGEAILG